MTREPSRAGTASAHGVEAVRAARRIRWRERVLGLAAPLLGLRPPGRSWTGGAPVLLYHRVHDDGEPCDDPFAVARSAFAEQVRWLTGHFRVVTVGEVARRVRECRDVSGVAAISFDDGYDCTFRNAWPVLRSLGAPATLFVDTQRLDGPSPALGSAELRAMADEGLEVGSHTVTHQNVTGMSAAGLADELERSAARLREVTEQPVEGFAYPFGRYGERDVRLVREAGYRYACTCRQDRTNHPGDDPFQLTRVEINHGDDARRFARKVRGGYAVAYAALYRLAAAASHRMGT